MAADDFPACLAIVLKEEGGLSLLKSDPGNWTGGKVGVGELKGTKYGIAAASFPQLDIPNLTIATAGGIYRRNYFNAAGCNVLPPGVSLAVFDPAVNSGVSRAIKWRNATASITDPVKRVQAICASRRGFYQSLKTFATFGRGWMARVARIEAIAVRMALEGVGLKPGAVQAELTKHGQAASAKAKKATTSAGGTAAAGGGAATVGSGHVSIVLICIAAAVMVGLVIYLIHRAKAQRALSVAYAEAARSTGVAA